MEDFAKKKDWIIPTFVILFLLVFVLLPFAVTRTYAGRSDDPNHTLTYTTGKLTWDSATDIDKETGVAQLNLFDNEYQNVQSENGSSVIAPGTEGQNIVRLKNDSDNPVDYIAVMYRIKEEDNLNVETILLDNNAFEDTESYYLPEGVNDDQVIRAVFGNIGANEIQDFDIVWSWNFYESEENDLIDTTLGNSAAMDDASDIKVGLYIIVMDDGNYIYPQVPETWDSSNITLYLVLLIISGVLLLLMFLEKRKQK